MDKTDKRVSYVYDKNIITVERHFLGTKTVNEIIEQYILEHSKVNVANLKEMYYNDLYNTAVVNSPKEEVNEYTTK